jgi:fructan beta-fructosidase
MMKIFVFCSIAWSLTNGLGLAQDRPDILLADFEGDDYGDWKATGTAFGKGPARGTLPNQMPVSGFKGRGLVNSFRGGDGSTGTLTSPEITINRKYIAFLIGGGGWEGKTCMNLIVNGKVVRTATGPNTVSGGSEHLEPAGWDVAEFQGRKARLQIVDEATMGWGHINVDHIEQTDRRVTLLAFHVTRELTAEKRFLHLPVKNGAAMRRLKLKTAGQTVRDFEIELAYQIPGKPDWWAAVDVSPWIGKKIVIEVDRLRDDSLALEQIKQVDFVPDADRVYREKHRPQFHFTSQRGWLNDPNGLVYYQGEYHLFYQHNPYGWNWGNMHWGHAVSKDLIHWRELPIALYPPRFGDWCFSGSAVVDERNTSSFKKGREDVLVAAFTSTGRGECMVYSNDRGRTWQEFEGNPVVKHQGRDPRLLWHEPSRRWVMAVYDELENRRFIAFYNSANLKDWQFQSRIEGFFECPDLFELPVQGTTKTLWVLYGGDGKYVLGRFDGKAFHVESGKHQLWHGHFYAAQTYSNAPAGRRIQIGWGSGIAIPGMPFNQQMCIPCDLSLRETPAGPRMFARPVKEISKLFGKKFSRRSLEVKPGENPLADLSGDLFDIQAEIDSRDADGIVFNLRGITIHCDVKKQTVTCRDKQMPLPIADGKIRLRILLDRCSIEVFANDGQTALSIGVIPADANRRLGLAAHGGTMSVESLDVTELHSAW